MKPKLFARGQQPYHHVASSSEEILASPDHKDDDERQIFDSKHRSLQHRWPPLCFIWLNIALFLSSCTMFILSLQPRSPEYVDRIHEQMRNYHLRQFSMPSPVLDEIDIDISRKRMAATLLNTNPPIIYRQPPSPSVDRAWEKLYDTRPIPLTRAQVIAMGKDPSVSVHIPPSWGYGNDTYFGRLDVFHQLHCLDALRREAHFEHYYGKKYPGGFNETSEMHKLHLSHCVWLLAQNIMCSGNTDVYTHVWTDTFDHPFPDFEIEHQCKNYDAVMEWQRRNALDERKFVELKRPEGYPYRVMTHKFKEIHGFFSEHEDDGDFTSGEIG